MADDAGTQRPLRAAVVGVGHLGRHHARIYHELPGVELVAVVDEHEGRLREAAEKHGALALPDIGELIALHERDPALGFGAGSIDMVSVAVPTAHHHEVAVPLLAAGMNLLVEKPLATTSAEARSLCEEAARRGLILQVGHVERFNPALRGAFDLVSDPRYIVGDRLSPFSFRSIDIGVVMDLMIHDLDVVMELVGSQIKKIDAVGVPVLSSKSEDIANVRIVFANDCVANLSASRVSVKRMRKLRLFQEDGYVSIDFDARRVQVITRSPEVAKDAIDMQQLAALPPEQRDLLLFGKLLQVREFSMDDGEEPLLAELRAFAETVRGSKPERAPASGEEGVRAIEIAEMIRESIREYLDAEIARSARKAAERP